MLLPFTRSALIHGSESRCVSGTSSNLARPGVLVRSTGALSLSRAATSLSFGTGGIVTTQIKNGDGQAFALAIQPADQKIVAGGDVHPSVVAQPPSAWSATTPTGPSIPRSVVTVS